MKASLAELLKFLRKSRGHTMREVEAITENKISNSYLCQIEAGKIKKPSPEMLYTLAEAYAHPYDELMELAGYISARGAHEPAIVVTNRLGKLSDDEERELMQFLGYIRSRAK